MHDSITCIGMDVHKERIHVVAVNEAEGPGCSEPPGRGTAGLLRPGAVMPHPEFRTHVGRHLRIGPVGSVAP
jgi:hypothetical protein